jgi:hypothetical protein
MTIIYLHANCSYYYHYYYHHHHYLLLILYYLLPIVMLASFLPSSHFAFSYLPTRRASSVTEQRVRCVR